MICPQLILQWSYLFKLSKSKDFMISIDIKIDGKRLDYYSTHWDAISNKLIIELDSKELKQTEPSRFTTAHLTLTDIISWDYKRFLSNSIIGEIESIVKKIIETKSIPTIGKYANFIEDNKFEDILTTFSDNIPMLNSIVKRELVNFIFFKSKDALKLREKYFVYLVDVLNFKNIKEESDIEYILTTEKVKAIARLMLKEMQEAKNAPGCTACKINGIRAKYNQILLTTNFKG